MEEPTDSSVSRIASSEGESSAAGGWIGSVMTGRGARVTSAEAGLKMVTIKQDETVIKDIKGQMKKNTDKRGRVWRLTAMFVEPRLIGDDSQAPAGLLQKSIKLLEGSRTTPREFVDLHGGIFGTGPVGE